MLFLAYTFLLITGLFISANYTLASVIILEIMPLSDFIGAYGLLGFVEGIGTLVGPALAGMQNDRIVSCRKHSFMQGTYTIGPVHTM